MKHPLTWFEAREGKRIFRDEVSCKCHTCVENGDKGLIVRDKQHADYLHTVQLDLDIDFRDNI